MNRLNVFIRILLTSAPLSDRGHGCLTLWLWPPLWCQPRDGAQSLTRHPDLLPLGVQAAAVVVVQAVADVDVGPLAQAVAVIVDALAPASQSPAVIFRPTQPQVHQGPPELEILKTEIFYFYCYYGTLHTDSTNGLRVVCESRT